jgi:hypothetical protein
MTHTYFITSIFHMDQIFQINYIYVCKLLEPRQSVTWTTFQLVSGVTIPDSSWCSHFFYSLQHDNWKIIFKSNVKFNWTLRVIPCWIQSKKFKFKLKKESWVCFCGIRCARNSQTDIRCILCQTQHTQHVHVIREITWRLWPVTWVHMMTSVRFSIRDFMFDIG